MIPNATILLKKNAPTIDPSRINNERMALGWLNRSVNSVFISKSNVSTTCYCNGFIALCHGIRYFTLLGVNVVVLVCRTSYNRA